MYVAWTYPTYPNKESTYVLKALQYVTTPPIHHFLIENGKCVKTWLVDFDAQQRNEISTDYRQILRIDYYVV